MLKLGWKDDSDHVHRQTVSSAANTDLTFDTVDAFQLSYHLKCLLEVYVRTHCERRVASFARVDCYVETLCRA